MSARPETFAAQRSPPCSLRETLLAEPSRFSFDAAIAVMMRLAGKGDPGDAIRFVAPTGLAFVASDVLSVAPDSDGFHATVGLLGLVGPAGTLPRVYSEHAIGERRGRAGGLGDFLDLLAQRPIAQFADAAIKYRPHQAANADALAGPGGRRFGMRDAILALAGYGSRESAARVAIGPDPLLFYAGAFATEPRSADRLQAILSDWLGREVQVEQFCGAWLELDPDQMSALPSGIEPGQFNRLGVDTAAGARPGAIHSRVVRSVGPRPRAAFEAMLPGRHLLDRIVAFVRAFLDEQIGFAVNPILAAEEVPKPALRSAAAPSLGWNMWLPTSARQEDAADALFDARDICPSGCLS